MQPHADKVVVLYACRISFFVKKGRLKLEPVAARSGTKKMINV